MPVGGLHQPHHPLARTSVALVEQFAVDPRRAIGLGGLVVDLDDPCGQLDVALLA